MVESGSRILFVLPFFVIGGTEDVALTLARYLKIKCYSVTFCILHRAASTMLAEIESGGFTLLDWTTLPIEEKIVRLAVEIARNDLMHAHLPYVDGVIGKALEKATSNRVVITSQLPNLNLAAYLQLDAIVSCCEYVKRTSVEPFGVETHTILNGSDIAKGPAIITKIQAREKLGLPLQTTILGRISRLDEEKFPPQAYETWKRLLTANPTVTGVIVGDGAIRNSLNESIKRDGLEGRLILPGTTRDRMEWLASFDSFIYSTDADACPLALVEAMGAGLPIVAPNFCGIPELIKHGESGFLYRQNNWDEMLALSQRLIDDLPMAQRMGICARKAYLQLLTGDAMCRQYETLYESLLASEKATFVVESVSGIACEIVHARVGHGHVGIGGELGYDGKIPSGMYRYRSGIISAHAPSRVVLRAQSAGTIRIRAMFDETARNAKVVSHAQITDLNGRVLVDLGFFNPESPTPIAELALRSNEPFVLLFDCTTTYTAHTMWVLDRANVSICGPAKSMEFGMSELFSRAMTVVRGDSDSHDLFVQTCATRFTMALRNVASHLVCAGRKPKRVLILSFDDLSPVKESLPPWCEFLSGVEDISKALRDNGVTDAAIKKICQENMFAKYVVPRLLLGPKVLVSDDDVIWCGPAHEMLNCNDTYFFLEDLPGFYGNASINLFKSAGLVDAEAIEPPYLCAGLYLINNGPIRNARFISEVIERAESHRDEQSAVGMETRIKGVTYQTGRYPKYHHGGYGPQPIPERFDVMHLQGQLMTLRDHSGFQSHFANIALETHGERSARSTRPNSNTDRYGVYIPLHPDHAGLLELNLMRAAEIGALKNAVVVYVIENDVEPKFSHSRTKGICDRFGVVHQYASESVGPFGLCQTRQMIEQFYELFQNAPDISWLIRCDVDVLLDGDAWHYFIQRGKELELDICAEIRPDFRFDDRGYLIMPCAAFSKHAIETIRQYVCNEKLWHRLLPALPNLDDADLSMLARLLGLKLGSPMTLIGYHAVRDIFSISDLINIRMDQAQAIRAFHFKAVSVEEKCSLMRNGFSKLSTPLTQKMPSRRNALDRIIDKVNLATTTRDVDISVLVCCRNFRKRFTKFAESILSQDWPVARIEVIVANPDSPDGLHNLLSKLADVALRRFGTPIFYEERIDPKHGRNRGLMIQKAFERSQGTVVIGMDCDLILPPDFLRHIYSQTLQHPNTIVGVYRNFLSPETTEKILAGEIDPIESLATLLKEDNSENQGYRGVLGYCQSAIAEVWKIIGYPIEYDEIAKSDVSFIERARALNVHPRFLDKLRVLHLHHPRNWMGTDERL